MERSETTTGAGHARGDLLVLAAAALFSTGGAALKACDLPGAQIACYRAGIAALAMLLFVPAARRAFAPGALTLRTVIVGVPYAATLLLFAFSNRLTTAANAIFLQSTAPLWMLLLSPWLLGERIRRADVAFLVVLAGGLALLLTDRADASATAVDPALGNVLGAASGLTWALAVSGLRWLARDDRGAGGDGAAAGATVAGNALAFVACLPAAGTFVSPHAQDWGVLVFLGVFQVALAYACLTRGVQRVPAFEASLLLLLEPVLNPVWAWLVHGEEPGVRTLAGGGVILAATAVYTLTAARAREA